MSTSLIDEIDRIHSEVPIESQTGSGFHLEPIERPKKKKRRRKKQPSQDETELSQLPTDNSGIENTAYETTNPAFEITNPTLSGTEINEPEIHNDNFDRDPNKTSARSDQNNNQLDTEHTNAAINDTLPLPPDNILGIYIHRTDHITFSMRRILVKVTLLNGNTGEILKKQLVEKASTSFYETERNTQVPFILPMMTTPFRVDVRKSLLPEWEELLQINESFDYILSTEHNGVVLFQVMDCLENGLKTVGWAYLRLLDAQSGTSNVNKRLRLQLHQTPSNLPSDETAQLKTFSQLLLQNQKNKIKSSIHITISSLLPFDKRVNDTLDATQRSMRADQKEIGKSEIVLGKELQNLPSSESIDGIEIEWKRLPGNPSLVPNTLYDKSETEDFGGFCVRFSPDGTHIAWTTATQFEHKIIIERFLDNRDKKKAKFSVTAHSGLIYDLDWSSTGSYLIACSADQTASIWHIPKNLAKQKPIQIGSLPAPCYLYSVRFNPGQEPLSEIYLFGQDGNCYIYSQFKDDFLLKNEIEITDKPINSASFSCDKTKLLCVSSNGYMYTADLENWRISASFSETKISDVSADCIVGHPKIPQKIAVFCRDNSVHYIDLRTSETHVLAGVQSRGQLKRCCFSPCGSLLLAGCETGAIVCWNTVRKEKVCVIANADLGFTAACRDISFHPSYHAFGAISYQPGTGVSIWRHDKALARSKSRTRVSIVPSEEHGPDQPSKIYSKQPTLDQKKHFENLPPIPEPIFGSNFKRVKSQFDLALERMATLSQIDTNQSAMTLNELNTSHTRNLFPSSGQDVPLDGSDNLDKMKSASSSLRLSVQNRLRSQDKFDSHIRSFSPVKQKSEERPKLEDRPAEVTSAPPPRKVEIDDRVGKTSDSNFDQSKPSKSKVEFAEEHQGTENQKRKKRKKKSRPPLPIQTETRTLNREEPETTSILSKIESTEERVPGGVQEGQPSYLDILQDIANQ